MLSYVLVSVHEGHESDLADKLTDFSNVIECRILFGEWDLLVKVNSENTDSLATFVMEKIRSESYVKLTSTLIVAK